MTERSPLDLVRGALAYADANSFQLMSEDAWLIPSSALPAYLAGIPGDLAVELAEQSAEFHRRAHAWCTKYNFGIRQRVRGYVQLARACRYEYPWPVVAILGICTVIDGEQKSTLYGVLGEALRRLGKRDLAELADRTKDMLRRTNRAIFADSVPVVLYALQCHNLRARGRVELAEALAGAPLPPLMDEMSATLIAELGARLQIVDARERFDALAELTLRHFEREQRILSFNLGVRDWAATPARVPATGVKQLLGLREVEAPTISSSRRLEFRKRPLPDGFDLKDHRERVRVFGELYVRSVTGSPDAYAIAVDYVEREFGAKPYATPSRRNAAPAAFGLDLPA